jgi:hypothetical protein
VIDLDGPQITWRKSSRSGASGACVEVAFVGDLVLVRDSKDATAQPLCFGTAAWQLFLAGVKGDEFGCRVPRE